MEQDQEEVKLRKSERDSTISFVACIPIDVATESVWLDLDKNAGSSDFQTWVAHDRRRSRPLATSSVENPRSIAGKTRSETPPSFALAEEHGDNEERNSYGQNGILGKAWRPHDGGSDRRKSLTARVIHNEGVSVKCKKCNRERLMISERSRLKVYMEHEKLDLLC
ncbi:hypothetical protein YC2023_039827 [Brassica napus]